MAVEGKLTRAHPFFSARLSRYDALSLALREAIRDVSIGSEDWTQICGD
jgi:hypothetical protein